jgi:hypothetical protein
MCFRAHIVCLYIHDASVHAVLLRTYIYASVHGFLFVASA